MRIGAALERARDDLATAPTVPVTRGGGPFRRMFAMGDPQAPCETALHILDLHGALGDDGRLSPDVHLVSMGDHFDWGRPADRKRAARSGLLLLSWLAAHSAEQVTLLLGNHDLGRVGELAAFDDARFARARAEADAIYHDGHADAEAEVRFLARYPELPSAELAARDMATFTAAQQTLVRRLLVTGRFLVASAPAPDLLLCHAGVTRDDLHAAGASPREQEDAHAIATALNNVLVQIVSAWDGGVLSLGTLHRPGNARDGEGRGIFYHRPSHPAYGDPDLYDGPPRRRFDPRWLPLGLTQAIGHIRDHKCRSLLHEWAAPEPAEDGPLRYLRTDGTHVTYRRGVPRERATSAATLLFLDGGMLHTSPENYELLDLQTRAPADRTR
jgi:hypothetical protein